MASRAAKAGAAASAPEEGEGLLAGGGAMASEWPLTEQEMRMQELMGQLEKLLRKAEKAKNPDKLHGFLKDTTVKLKECKA